ncbi:hypothetical protein TcCL_ESM11087, partial [Trypanosoma cruzi]
QIFKRHATLTPNTRPSSTDLGSRRALPAHAVRDALPLRRNVRHLLPQSSSSVYSASLTIPGMPRPRNTHSATMSCRLSSTIMSATLNAYWRTCSMRCNHMPVRFPSCSASCCPPTAWSGSSHPLDQRSGCCKGLPSSAAFLENTNVRKKLPPSYISALSHTHKGGVIGKRSPPQNGCTRAHAKATPSTSHRKI